MNTFWMMFKENRNTDFDVQIPQRPNIPSPVRRVSYIQIAGRDGTLTQTDDTYEDIEFPVLFNYLTSRRFSFMNQSRAVKNWLTGSGKLKFSDDNEVFYKCKNARISDAIERVYKRAGFFSALFTCDPFTYFESGLAKLPISECRLNPYSTCHPEYYITGNGNCTLTVNGTSSDLVIPSNLVIDTDLMVMYKEDGTLRNNTAHLPYELFRFQNGLNEISITNGFDLRIKPNWRSL